MGAPVGDDMSAFSTSFDVNYDFSSGGIGMGSFMGDFGGVGSFTPFDMNINSFPDFNSSGSIFGSDMYGF